MAIIRWIAGFVITAFAAAFAVINRHSIEVFWNPLGGESLNLPVYLCALGFMALGFFFGAAAVWMNMGRLRSERRKQKREIKSLNRRVDAAQETVVQGSDRPHKGENLPVLSVQAH